MERKGCDEYGTLGTQGIDREEQETGIRAFVVVGRAGRIGLLLLPFFIDVISIVTGYWFAVVVVGWFSPHRIQSLEVIHFSVPLFIYLVILQLVGVYEKTQSLMNIEEMRGLVKGCFLGTLVNQGFFVLFVPHVLLPQTLLLGGAFFFLISASCRLLSYKFEQYLHKKNVITKRILLVGTGPTCLRILEKLREHPKLGLVPYGVVVEEEYEALEWEGIPVKGRIKDLPGLLSKLPVDEVLSVIPPDKSLTWEGPGTVLEIANLCKKNRLRFRWAPSLTQTSIQRIVVEDLAGFPLVELRELRLRPWQRHLKRGFDLALATILGVAFGWLFLLLAYWVRKTSEGPVFFAQTRIGMDGRPFTMYKFRTMHVGSEPFQKKPNRWDDPRVTKAGRWLRRSSLDELPQLWNVIKGDMSLVGPRPEMPFIVEKYTEMERERLNVKPGITGLWQISVDRGKDIHANLEYDLYYIREWSLFLDMAILLRTIVSVLWGAGAV